MFGRLDNTKRWVKFREYYYLSKHYKFYKDMQTNKSCKSFLKVVKIYANRSLPSACIYRAMEKQVVWNILMKNEKLIIFRTLHQFNLFLKYDGVTPVLFTLKVSGGFIRFSSVLPVFYQIILFRIDTAMSYLICKKNSFSLSSEK